eukprot:scaffold35732_cov17-Tisochrysis_lutea.AAC.2
MHSHALQVLLLCVQVAVDVLGINWKSPERYVPEKKRKEKRKIDMNKMNSSLFGAIVSVKLMYLMVKATGHAHSKGRKGKG